MQWFNEQVKCRRFKNLKKKCVLPIEMVTWRTDVIRVIESYKSKKNIYENYSSFLTNRDDFVGHDHWKLSKISLILFYIFANIVNLMKIFYCSYDYVQLCKLESKRGSVRKYTVCLTRNIQGNAFDS